MPPTDCGKLSNLYFPMARTSLNFDKVQPTWRMKVSIQIHHPSSKPALLIRKSRVRSLQKPRERGCLPSRREAAGQLPDCAAVPRHRRATAPKADGRRDVKGRRKRLGQEDHSRILDGISPARSRRKRKRELTRTNPNSFTCGPNQAAFFAVHRRRSPRLNENHGTQQSSTNEWQSPKRFGSGRAS